MTAQLEHDVVMPADDAHDAGFSPRLITPAIALPMRDVEPGEIPAGARAVLAAAGTGWITRTTYSKSWTRRDQVTDTVKVNGVLPKREMYELVECVVARIQHPERGIRSWASWNRRPGHLPSGARRGWAHDVAFWRDPPGSGKCAYQVGIAELKARISAAIPEGDNEEEEEAVPTLAIAPPVAAAPNAAELAEAHDAGFAKGWVARGEVQNTGDCYLPVPLPWRLVNVGDVVVSPDGRLWTVEQLGPNAHRRVGVIARCGATMMNAGVERGDIGLDPDAQVLVLEAAPLATAEAVVRAQFTAARTLARTETRSAP